MKILAKYNYDIDNDNDNVDNAGYLRFKGGP